MGIDVGTTGTKAAVFDLEGRLLASAYREYPLVHPQPGWIELDSNVVLAAAKQAVREAASQVPRDPVKALAIACQGEACTPLDENGEPLDNAIVTFDDRTAQQGEWWEKELGKEAVFQITGMPLNRMHTGNKLMWLKEHKPQVFHGASRFLCYEELVMEKMGVEPVIDYSLAGRTMAFDIRARDWSGEMLRRAGIDEALLPRAAPSGTAVGEVSPPFAEDWGLPRGTLVCTGGHDQPCGALGAGVVASGVAADSTGTVECITAAFSEPVLTAHMLAGNYCCYPHVVTGLYVTLAFNFTGGSVLRWYRDNFGASALREAERSSRDVYDLLIEGATAGPVDLFLLPHFTVTGTPWYDADARGAILGLRLATSAGDILKAALDGVTYEMRLNLDRLSEAGVEVREIRAVGGGARSAAWLALKANIFNRPVVVPDVTEATCLGAAILAGVASEAYSSAREGAEATVRLRETYEPQPDLAGQYEQRYRTYAQIYPTAVSLLHRMSSVRF